VRSLPGVFDSSNMEAMLMHWFKRDMSKAAFAIAGILLLLMLMVWVPVSGVDAYEGTSGLAAPITALATPTEDATVTELNKEKLAQEVQQLKNQNDPDPFGWLQTNASIFLSTLVVVIGGLLGFWRWRVDRQDAQARELKDRRDAQDKELEDRKVEREKRAEERFQIVVSGLGSKDIEAKVGAAILLRTFLKPGYEQFYQQSFDLAVAHLRLRQVNSNEPIDSLSQALIRVFTESSKLVREQLGLMEPREYNKHLDAAHIRLDGAYLARVSLQNVWIRDASFIGANLHSTNLRESDLIRANFHKADLDRADLSKARLRIANLSGTILTRVNLTEADLYRADLTDANLHEADLRGANLEGTILKDTDLRGVKGLTKDQLKTCKAKGAIIDEDSTTSSSQSPVSPSLSSQGRDEQASSATPAEERMPASDDTGGRNVTSSQQGTES
jgi:uncharacterized protein YjbI with pentapeptide repeats